MPPLFSQPDCTRSLFGKDAFFSRQPQSDLELKTFTLIKALQAIIDEEKQAQSSFLACVNELMTLDAELLQSIIQMTRRKLVIHDQNQSILANYLEEIGKTVTATIDYLQGIALNNNDDDDKELATTKQMVKCAVAAISMLEKLLFPQMKLRYCQQITVIGFTLAEKEALGTFLEKIDPNFSIQTWMTRWEMKQIPSTGSFQIFKNTTVRLDEDIKNPPRCMKCGCRCG